MLKSAVSLEKKLGSGKIFLTLKFFAVFFSLCKKSRKMCQSVGIWALRVERFSLIFQPLRDREHAHTLYSLIHLSQCQRLCSILTDLAAQN